MRKASEPQLPTCLHAGAGEAQEGYLWNAGDSGQCGCGAIYAGEAQERSLWNAGERKVCHLLMLVGGNPLPNAVAGKLLVAPGGTITLVHSGGAAGTGKVAQRLKQWLEEQARKEQTSVKVELKEVSESNPSTIVQGVKERLEAVNAPSVGLNYTGGTKAMAVHAYRTVEQWAKEKGITPVLSCST